LLRLVTQPRRPMPLAFCLLTTESTDCTEGYRLDTDRSNFRVIRAFRGPKFLEFRRFRTVEPHRRRKRSDASSNCASPCAPFPNSQMNSIRTPGSSTEKSNSNGIQPEASAASGNTHGDCTPEILSRTAPGDLTSIKRTRPSKT